MPYPIIIKDDFFSDPDAIEKIAIESNYCINDEVVYPGVRSQCLSEINRRLFLFIGDKIFSLFHDNLPTYYNMKIAFQKINPFVQDKWNKKNLGWFHKDTCLFGGVVYLDKNPDFDSGTSVYKSKDGYDLQTQESMQIKKYHYSGREVSQEEYDKGYDYIRDQYDETLRIPNVYNRLLLIPGDQWHCMTTTGDKERHTLTFFCSDVTGVYSPDFKMNTSSISNDQLYT